MPDLRNSPIIGSDRTFGDNYRRAFDGFSRFGTRRLAFYTVWVYNIDDVALDSVMEWEFSSETGEYVFPPEYIHPANSLLESVERGVQLMAEPYLWGEWNWDNGDSPGFYDWWITFAVAADTVMDGYGQDNESPVPVNPHSTNFEQAIGDAIGADFTFEGVHVERVVVAGEGLYEESNYALGTPRPARTGGVSAAKKAAIQAAGKSLYKR